MTPDKNAYYSLYRKFAPHMAFVSDLKIKLKYEKGK